jgi:DHA1 family bicyclomycin/chloramphenicol resistance-like MFS transporter
MQIQQRDLGFIEFVILMALLTSLAAMSIDAMLPALSVIAHDLGAENNEQQYVVSAFLLSFGIAQIIFGPLSDSFGRKPVIYLGIGIYLVGSIICIFAGDFYDIVLGRAIQGFGAGGPRVTIIALIRDKYKGNDMARVMSLIMMVFILAPILAPTIGQGILLVGEWQAIFIFLIVLALLSGIWLGVRQPETLHDEYRHPFSLVRIISAVSEILCIRASIGYTLMSGIMFSAFFGYLSSAQQVFQVTYQLGELFPLYFAILASGLGLASYFNSKLVHKFGMRRLCKTALVSISGLTIVFVCLVYAMSGIPPFYLFMFFMVPTFFCFGILVSNFVTLAMEPLAHIAGVGASVVGSISSLVAVPLGAIIGQQFDGTVLPLISGFALFSIITLMLMYWVERSIIPS